MFSRLSIKEGNLGLGAKNIRGVDEEPTGLADFQDLLGRLNGKSEGAIQRTQQVRGELARHRYLERRGTIAFVKGGYMEREELKENEPVKQDKSEAAHKKKSLAKPAAVHKDRAEIKIKSHEDSNETDAQAKFAKKQRKQERRQQKRLKKLAMEERTLASSRETAEAVVEAAAQTTATSVQPTSNRNLVRQRYIRQKQLAMVDPKALNEVSIRCHVQSCFGLTSIDINDQRMKQLHVGPKI